MTRPYTFLLLLSCAAAMAAQPRLVKDINPGSLPVDSDPGGFASVGSVTFFFANDREHGNELWKTDGTEAGTVLVRDIRPGLEGGVPMNQLGGPTANGRVFFQAFDPEHGQEGWASDGTAEGTVLLADIAPGPASSNVVFGRVAGDVLYFVATSPAAGTEVWRTDGTPAGTRMVIDLRPGPSGSSPRFIATLGTLVVFRGNDGTSVSLYTSDGTAAGTKRVVPAFTAGGTSLGDIVLYTNADTENTWSLMRTDGTSEGTTLIRSGFSGLADEEFRVAGGIAYFTANDGVHGREVWRTDGTPGGTSLVADFTPGAQGSALPFLDILDGRLLVLKDREKGELFVSDGTPAGTQLISARPGATAGFVYGDTYYFACDDGVHGFEPWKSDGTAEGTMLIADVRPGAQSGLDLGGYYIGRPEGIFFAGNNGVTGSEPWISDGTPGGTRMVKNVARDTAEGSSPLMLQAVGGTLFFSAYAGIGIGNVLWKTDGTEAGTVRLDVPANLARPAFGAVSSGGLYYFLAGDFSARELWRTDGTRAGTIRLVGGAGRAAYALRAFQGGVFFQGLDREHGLEPWFSDGTVAGTRLIADLKPGPSSSFIDGESATVIGDYVYFGGGVGLEPEPWRTDGTAAGTQRLATPNPEDSLNPRAFTRLGDSVYFISSVDDNAFTLNRTNIASGETAVVRHVDDVSTPRRMATAGGMLVMLLRGSGVWRSDGTESGTMFLADAAVPQPCADDGDFLEADGIYYWYVTKNWAPELWRTDGTAAGTFPLVQFEGWFSESLSDCHERTLHSAGGKIYFLGGGPVYGAEPWVTDGTVAGTHLLADINPGPASSDVDSFLAVGRTLYFTAADALHGEELWAMPLSEPSRRRAVRK